MPPAGEDRIEEVVSVPEPEPHQLLDAFNAPLITSTRTLSDCDTVQGTAVVKEIAMASPRWWFMKGAHPSGPGIEEEGKIMCPSPKTAARAGDNSWISAGIVVIPWDQVDEHCRQSAHH